MILRTERARRASLSLMALGALWALVMSPHAFWVGGLIAYALGAWSWILNAGED